jgi:hypothetical protein
LTKAITPFRPRANPPSPSATPFWSPSPK